MTTPDPWGADPEGYPQPTSSAEADQVTTAQQLAQLIDQRIALAVQEMIPSAVGQVLGQMEAQGRIPRLGSPDAGPVGDQGQGLGHGGPELFAPVGQPVAPMIPPHQWRLSAWPCCRP